MHDNLSENEVADNQKHDLIISPANLATMTGNSGYGIMRDAALAVRDGRISWIGPASNAKYLSAGTVLNAEDKWLTPGLIDCHTHLVYAGTRAEEFEQRLNGKTYEEIAKAGGGILSTVRATREASEEELLHQSEKRLKSFLAEGVTTLEIKSGYGLDLANETKILRVARNLAKKYPVTIKTTFLGAHALPPEFKDDADGYIAYLCEETLPKIAKENLADAVDGFCETIGFTPQQITTFFDAAKKLGLPVKLHAEQLSDLGGTALAAKYHALSADHLEYANEDGIKAMAESGSVAVLLPGAFYMLHETKKPPVNWLRKHQVPMALATDCNPGTSPATSLLLMLSMGATLFGLTPLECLQGVTCHAAKALAVADQAGTLEVGKWADIAIWDIAHPAELTYHIGYNPCRGVIRHGAYRSAGTA